MSAGTGLTVQEAYNIDKKIDDGWPQSGAVTAQAFWYNGGLYWAGTQPFPGSSVATMAGPPDTTPTLGTSSTCFDNGNVNGAQQQYSLGQNNGKGLNCALSFEFQ